MVIGSPVIELVGSFLNEFPSPILEKEEEEEEDDDEISRLCARWPLCSESNEASRCFRGEPGAGAASTADAARSDEMMRVFMVVYALS